MSGKYICGVRVNGGRSFLVVRADRQGPTGFTICYLL